jgi:hypothetical protein
MADTAPKSKWNLVLDRFRSLNTVEWESTPPESDEERRTRAELEHHTSWLTARRPVRTTDDPAYVKELVAQSTILAWRTTRALAVSTQLIHAKAPLSTLPLHPSPWTTALPTQDHPFPVPTALTLDPRACPAEPFLLVMAHAFNRMGLMAGTPAHYIAQWILEEPNRVYLLWPTPHDLMAFEHQLVRHLTDLTLKRGRLRAHRYLTDKVGLLQDEADATLAMSLATFKALGKVDADVERGIAIARAEDAARRAREALDIKNEVAALKLHAAVVGLTREAPSDRDRDDKADLLDAIFRVAQEDGAPGARGLPGPSQAGGDSGQEGQDS